MVTARAINNIIPDLEGNLERDLNIFVRAVLTDLSTEENSPVDTGFFASSWTAGTQRPNPNEPRETVAPWSNIKPTRRGARSPQARVEPRFINEIPNFKPFSKVFIGNTSQYAARALGSPRSQIPQYVQGEIPQIINRIFTERKPRIGVATFGTGVRGKSDNVRFTGKGIGQFSDPKSVFVDYENL